MHTYGGASSRAPDLLWQARSVGRVPECTHEIGPQLAAHRLRTSDARRVCLCAHGHMGRLRHCCTHHTQQAPAILVLGRDLRAGSGCLINDRRAWGPEQAGLLSRRSYCPAGCLQTDAWVRLTCECISKVF